MFTDASGVPRSGTHAPGQSSVYDAFISYDHDDRPVANGIQRGLHRIGRRVGQLRALRVFRDSTDLTASPNLWGKVVEAMDSSRFLIVVLSTAAALSTWVNKEVDHWLQRRGPEQLLFVVASGQVVWDEATQRFDPDRSNAVPPVLTAPGALPNEPLYVDVSQDAPWDTHSTLFREKVIDLAAPIHGKPKSELSSEDLNEQRRFRRLRRAAVAGLALLTIVALVAATLAFVQRQQAIHQRNEAIARELVSEAQSILAGVRGGNDAQAVYQVLAAQKIASQPDEGAVLNALQATIDQLKIIDNPTAISEVALSADGRRIMSAGGDTFPNSTVTFRDAGTGRITATFPAFAFSPDGGQVLSYSADNRLQVRDTETGTPVGPSIEVNKDGGAIMKLAFSPDNRQIVFAQYPSMLYSWDILSGEVSSMTGFSGGISDIAFLPDRHRVVTSGDDGAIRVWDNQSNRQLAQPISKSGPGLKLAVSPDGRRIATDGELSNGIRIWDLDSGQLIAHGEAHPAQFRNYVFALSYSRDGRRVVSGSNDRTLQVWDAETAAPIGGPLVGHRDIVNSVAFSADGAQVISASSDKTIRIWNANPTKTLATPIANSVISDVAISPDGRRIVGTDAESITVWDAHTLKPLLPHMVGETYAIALSHDGSRIAALSGTRVTIWDANTGAKLHEWDVEQPISPAFAQIIFSPDGHKVASFGSSVNDFGQDDQTMDTSLVVWDVDSGVPIGPRIDEHLKGSGGITSASFSPDSRYLAHNKDDGLTIIDIASGQRVKKFDTGIVEEVAWRPDGKQILIVGSASNGSTIARSIRLLDPRSGRVIAEMTDPVGIERPVFTADAKYIISGHDNDIRIWDVDKHVAIGDLTGGTSSAGVVGISDDDRNMVAVNMTVEVGGDTSVTAGLWPGPTNWVDLLCAKVVENMSDRDWDEWIGSEIPYTPVCPDKPKAKG
jgi:WD40 repeat protein